MVDYRSFFFGAALGAARSPRGRRFTGNTLVFCSDVPDRGAHEYRVRVDSEENYLRADMRVRGPNDLERGTRYRSTNPAIMQQPCYPWLTWSYLVRSLSQSVGYHIFAGDVWDVEPHRNDLYDDRQAVVTAIIPDVLRTPDFRTGGAVHMAEHIRQMSPLAFERLARAFAQVGEIAVPMRPDPYDDAPRRAAATLLDPMPAQFVDPSIVKEAGK